MRFLGTVLAVAILLGIGGCNRSGLVDVQGIVTVNGQPLPRGKIDFQSAEGKGPTAAAEIRDGKYQCPVMPGPKTVRITGGKVVGSHRYTPDNPASPMVEDIQSLVPPCYNTETKLACEIESGKTAYDFALKSKP
jgi:hypothetical protein